MCTLYIYSETFFNQRIHSGVCMTHHRLLYLAKLMIYNELSYQDFDGFDQLIVISGMSKSCFDSSAMYHYNVMIISNKSYIVS